MNKVDPDTLQQVEKALDVADVRRYEPYPAYKPSGIDWLGDVPEHWDKFQIRHLYKVLNGSTPSSSESSYWDGGIVWVTPDDLSKNSDSEIRDSRRRISQSGYNSCGATIAPPDSIVVSTRAPIGYVAIAGVSLCCNQGCRILVPNKTLNSKFFYYQLLSAGSELSSRGRGTTFTELSHVQLASVKLLFPPIEEQQAIARFLDNQTRKIDDLIEAKRKLLDLLKEKRQAIITHAVTKGIDPDVKMKPSGIEWLGDVPEHWEVIRLRFLASIDTGDKDTQDNVENGQYPFFVRSDTIERLNTYSFDTEAVMTSGDGAGVCKIYHHYKGKFALHQRMYVIYDFKNVVGKYIYYSMVANFEKEILKLSAKSTVDSLRMPMIKNFPILLPSENEQLKIVDYIEIKLGKIYSVISETNKAIERLTEYRIALISAAVTGKIDVRGRA